MNELTRAVIGAAMEAHRTLGPGLLESAYQQCLGRELTVRRIPYERERPLPLEYKGVRCECGYRLDFPAAGALVVEVKSVGEKAPVHEAQLLTYPRRGGWRVGLITNFNVPILRQEIKRKILGYEFCSLRPLCLRW